MYFCGDVSSVGLSVTKENLLAPGHIHRVQRACLTTLSIYIIFEEMQCTSHLDACAQMEGLIAREFSHLGSTVKS